MMFKTLLVAAAATLLALGWSVSAQEQDLTVALELIEGDSVLLSPVIAATYGQTAQAKAAMRTGTPYTVAITPQARGDGAVSLIMALEYEVAADDEVTHNTAIETTFTLEFGEAQTFEMGRNGQPLQLRLLATRGG